LKKKKKRKKETKETEIPCGAKLGTDSEPGPERKWEVGRRGGEERRRLSYLYGTVRVMIIIN